LPKQCLAMVALQMLAKPGHLGNRRLGDVCDDHERVPCKDVAWRFSFHCLGGVTIADEGFPCHSGWSGESDGMSVASTACPTPVFRRRGPGMLEDDSLPMRLDFLNACPPGNFSKSDFAGQPMKVENVVDDCHRDLASDALEVGYARLHWDHANETFGSLHKDAVCIARQPLQTTQPIVISCTKDQDVTRVEWIVDARKIRGTDKVIVSPPFEIPSMLSAVFKMMITPKFAMEGKGGASFKKSKGKGTVQLKCESHLDDDGTLFFQIQTGCDESIVSSVCVEEWNFADAPLYNCQEDWDFVESLDVAKRSFSVILEVWPKRSGQ